MRVMRRMSPGATAALQGKRRPDSSGSSMEPSIGEIDLEIVHEAGIALNMGADSLSSTRRHVKSTSLNLEITLLHFFDSMSLGAV